MSKNDTPLHKRAHFRRTREVITEIAKYEGINIQDYDLFAIRAYDTHGENLKGINVSYNTEGNYSCWVLDNRYDMFEVPAKTNEKGSPYGEFLFFSFNQNFQYFQFGTMSVKLNIPETKRTRFITEKILYRPFGKYMITFEGAINHITKVEYGFKFTPGVRSDEHNFAYDSYNSRKKNGYQKTQYDILASVGIMEINPEKLVGKTEVPIYKKKQSSNNKGLKPGNKAKN